MSRMSRIVEALNRIAINESVPKELEDSPEFKSLVPNEFTTYKDLTNYIASLLICDRYDIWEWPEYKGSGYTIFYYINNKEGCIKVSRVSGRFYGTYAPLIEIAYDIKSSNAFEMIFNKNNTCTMKRTSLVRKNQSTSELLSSKEQIKNIIYYLNEFTSNSNLKEDLSLKAINKINRAAWGEDALSIVLDNTSDKLDGYDDFGSGFDVSYQGSIKELLSEIIDIYSKAGIKIRKEGKNKISYDNGGQTVYITVVSDDDASTYTKNSQGYFIFIDNVE